MTATAAILVSMLVSFTLTPMMCSRLLRQGHGGHKEERDGLYEWMERVYMRMLGWALRHRILIAGLGIATMASTVPPAAMITSITTS